MSIFWTGVRVATVAFAMSAAIASTAAADDFMAQCKTGTPVPEADKICKCMSDKITGADRADVIEAMTKTKCRDGQRNCRERQRHDAQGHEGHRDRHDRPGSMHVIGV